MKSIKYLAACIISSAIALSASQAKASELCNINANNYQQFTSAYSIFNDVQNSPLRPFSNPQYYNIDNSAIAAPIYYTSINNGKAVVIAFDIKGLFAGLNIKQNDSVIQYIAIPQHSINARVLGVCVNGQYYPNGQRSDSVQVYDLPQGTQSAIQEAKYGIIQESTSEMFK